MLYQVRGDYEGTKSTSTLYGAMINIYIQFCDIGIDLMLEVSAAPRTVDAGKLKKSPPCLSTWRRDLVDHVLNN